MKNRIYNIFPRALAAMLMLVAFAAFAGFPVGAAAVPELRIWLGDTPVIGGTPDAPLTGYRDDTLQISGQNDEYTLTFLSEKASALPLRVEGTGRLSIVLFSGEDEHTTYISSVAAAAGLSIFSSEAASRVSISVSGAENATLQTAGGISVGGEFSAAGCGVQVGTPIDRAPSGILAAALNADGAVIRAFTSGGLLEGAAEQGMTVLSENAAEIRLLSFGSVEATRNVAKVQVMTGGFINISSIFSTCGDFATEVCRFIPADLSNGSAAGGTVTINAADPAPGEISFFSLIRSAQQLNLASFDKPLCRLSFDPADFARGEISVISAQGRGMVQDGAVCDFSIVPQSRVDIRLLPGYGAQATELLAGLGATELSGTGEYSFIMPETDLVFPAVFEAAADSVSVSIPDVTAAQISGLGGLLHGSAGLSVAPGDGDAFGEWLGERGYTFVLAADITLNQRISSAVGGEDRVTPVETLDSPVTVTLTLSDEAAAALEKTGAVYAVRLHGDDTTAIPARFDMQTKTLSFETDAFSQYAIVYAPVPPETGDSAAFAAAACTCALCGAAVLLRRRAKTV